MIYTTTSIREVIARVLRNTKIQDSGMIASMQEWIPEAMGMLKTKMVLSRYFEDITIVFNKGKLPCGMQVLDCVEYCGHRVQMDRSARAFGSYHSHHHGDGIPLGPQDESVFTSHPTTRPGPESPTQEQGTFNTYTITAYQKLPYHHGMKYQIEPGYIVMPFDSGIIRLHYSAPPHDSQGFPLIPDNENYKEALYYYVRAKMAGAGYNDRVFKEEQLMERFERYGQRARGEIRYPSPDAVQSSVENMSMLTWPVHYFEEFDKNN